MNKIPFIAFIAVLVFAPLAFATSEQWSMLLVQLIIAVSVFFFCLPLIPSAKIRLLSVPGIVPLLLLLAFMGLQLVPLPLEVVKLLSPASYQAYQPVLELLQGDPWMPLSVHPRSTIFESVRILTCILFYILTIQLLGNGERLKLTVKVCVWLAIGIAVFAIVQKYSSPHLLYWFRSFPSNAQPMGPWVNRSQYCGYMGMMVPLILAFALYHQPKNSEEPLRQRIVAFFSGAGGNVYIVLVFCVLVSASSIFVSLSRGGIISFTLAILLFFTLIAWKRARYSNLFYVGVFGCLMLAVTWFGWEPILKRFDALITSSGELYIDRFVVRQDCLQVIKDFWLTGSGFGTFGDIYPQYRTLPGINIIDHAHNDYLELLTDGGIIGFVLVAWFVLAVLHEGWKMLRRRRDQFSQLISIGAFSGIIAMLIHSVSDFNMHNGADALYFFFFCGLLVSAGNTRFYYNMEATLRKNSSWLTVEKFSFAGGLFLCVVLLMQGGAILARWKYSEVQGLYLSRQLSESHLQTVSAVVHQAARLDSTEAMYPAIQGEVQRYLQQPEKALQYYVLAGRKNPLDGSYLQEIALMLPKEQQQSADFLMEKGGERTFRKDQLLLTRAEWLLATGQRSTAMQILREALVGKTELIKLIMPLLQSFSFTREELAAVLPDDVESWLQCGTFFQKSGDLKNAQFFWETGLKYIDNAATIKPYWFAQLYHYYKKQKDEDKALEILRLGIEKLPNYPRFHEWLGDYYAKEGIAYRAEEEYQQVLLVEPHNEAIRKKIEKLSKVRGK